LRIRNFLTQGSQHVLRAHLCNLVQETEGSIDACTLDTRVGNLEEVGTEFMLLECPSCQPLQDHLSRHSLSSELLEDGTECLAHVLKAQLGAERINYPDRDGVASRDLGVDGVAVHRLHGQRLVERCPGSVVTHPGRHRGVEGEASARDCSFRTGCSSERRSSCSRYSPCRQLPC